MGIIYEYEEGFRWEVREDFSLSGMSWLYASFDECAMAMKERFPNAFITAVICK